MVIKRQEPLPNNQAPLSHHEILIRKYPYFIIISINNTNTNTNIKDYSYPD
jgi:uncharacterized protein Veg